jgi:hypothetical protein
VLRETVFTHALGILTAGDAIVVGFVSLAALVVWAWLEEGGGDERFDPSIVELAVLVNCFHCFVGVGGDSGGVGFKRWRW